MIKPPSVILYGRKAVGKITQLREFLTTDWDVIGCVPEETPEAQLREWALEARAMVSGRPDSTLPQLPKLEVFQIPFAGYDWITPDELPAGCTFCNAYEHEPAIAEYILLAMLEWEIGLCKVSSKFRQESWQGRTAGAGPTHGELKGKTVGILGYGHIGREVARRASAFGMRIVAIANSSKPAQDGIDWLGTHKDLERLLSESDYLAICCPLNEQTRDLINSDAFAAMKSNAVILNVARGPIVNEEALFNSLKSGSIRGAVIDVWYQYPTPDDPSVRPSAFPFHELDNVIMTPHNSGWTEETIERRWRFVAANLDRLARGEPLQNAVFTGTGRCAASQKT
ncbi:2-hydroxyacid dehydrogenase [Denitrobaculum tricleocarpae]|uniref:Phosphoglycerate dehydrogenase n=1 Tax=Denitrobaculum tricleocarpae TaxID=2591009 RepID=A0A545TUD0_9PROT|nr:2-hydroxyacid dehydrogenase [Denitrobaculum tricleocarpae]TQV80825.1 phosphoglycerate dehydrogenase [Denitrobaculum tricleocarpae]